MVWLSSTASILCPQGYCQLEAGRECREKHVGPAPRFWALHAGGLHGCPARPQRVKLSRVRWPLKTRLLQCTSETSASAPRSYLLKAARSGHRVFNLLLRELSSGPRTMAVTSHQFQRPGMSLVNLLKHSRPCGSNHIKRLTKIRGKSF